MFDEYTGWLLWWGWGSQFKILVFYLLMFLAFFVICYLLICYYSKDFVYLLVNSCANCMHPCMSKLHFYYQSTLPRTC